MSSKPSIDGVLVQWGERLFYPGNRIVKARTPRLGRFGSKAALIRSRIEATVRRAPQVMVKVTGGGRGMKAIAAHFCYISKNGRLEIEDDRGVVEQGREAMKDIERQWRYEPVPVLRTPRSTMSVIHGRPVRSLATNREPAVGG